MRTCFSSPKNNKKSDFSTFDCECNCHTPKEMQLNDDEDFLQNKRKSPKSYLSQSQIISSNKDLTQSECLCTCKDMCNCPCHCLFCLCCPCVSNKGDNNDYYKNLYYQVKSELDIERKRNDRIKYSKKVNENNVEKMKKEKDILLMENNSLKNKISELTNKLRR